MAPGALYRRAVRPALFRLGGGDAETAHERTLAILGRLAGHPRLGARLRGYQMAAAGPRTVFGIRFPGPVGLAAGMDKDGRAVPAWPALGFGFVEIGTVTWHPQPGNPRPRLFRLVDSGAVVNRMGFNNAGARALAATLADWRERVGPPAVPVGISLGKSKITPLDRAVDDYVDSLRVLYPHGDYFAINVSSPNTPGLRALQDREQLATLLAALRAEVRARVDAGEPDRPLLVKIAPDLTGAAIGEVLEVCAEHQVSGLIATNTTIARDGLAATDQALAAESGGLSGRPLATGARRVVEFVARETAGRLPIIGVGGIADPDGARRLLDAGASLLQLYTGLIFEGPGLIRRINRAVPAPQRAPAPSQPGER